MVTQVDRHLKAAGIWFCARIKLKSEIRVRTIIPFCVENLFKEEIMKKAVSVFNIRSGGALFCVLALLSFTAFGTSNANSLVELGASNVADGIQTDRKSVV